MNLVEPQCFGWEPLSACDNQAVHIIDISSVGLQVFSASQLFEGARCVTMRVLCTGVVPLAETTVADLSKACFHQYHSQMVDARSK